MNQIPAFDPLGLPAPVWLLFGLKVFGLWGHLVFMNLWLGGFGVGLVMATRRGATAEWGRRMLKAMPIFIALGVNAGIVPLLFIQVLYPQFYFTSTILQAWPWLAVIPLVMLAYACTYVYVLGGLGQGSGSVFARAAGWIAAGLFLVVGLLFAVEMQFLTMPDRWTGLAEPAVGGAVLGLNWPVTVSALQRFAMMAGMALGTAAAYLALDRELLPGAAARRTTDRPEDSARPGVLVGGLAIAGMVLYGGAALTYLGQVAHYLEAVPAIQLLAGAGPVAAAAAGIAYLMRPGRAAAAFLVLAQLGSLLFNAVARQIVQAGEIAPHFDLAAVPVKVQLSPILLFLVTFVVGLGVITWLLRILARAAAAPADAG